MEDKNKIPSLSYIQGLKNRLIVSIDETNEQEKLEQCLELLYADSMPGICTEEELTEVIRKSEQVEMPVLKM